jgi:hypothetical protein
MYERGGSVALLKYPTSDTNGAIADKLGVVIAYVMINPGMRRKW